MRERFGDVGLLILRLSAGVTMFGAHGLSKLLSFSERLDTFADPIGFGAPLSLTLAVFAEAVCSLLLAAGLFTRLAAVPLLITMLVAALIVHGDDPWNKKELPLLYAASYAALLLTGPGRWSLDQWIARRRGRKG